MYSSHYKRLQVASLWKRSWLWTPPALRKHGCRAPLLHCGSGEGGPRRDARRSFAGSSSVAWHCGENKPGTWQFKTESISGPLKRSSVGSTINCIATSKVDSVRECILRRPAVACLPPLPLAAMVPLCSAAAATVRHVRTALCARTTTYLSGTCADRNAAQVPAAAEQRSSLPSFEAPPSSAGKNKQQAAQKHAKANCCCRY